MSSNVETGKLRKSYSIKDYKTVIVYDVLFVAGFVFLEKYRIMFVFLLLLFNALYIITKNHKVIDVFEKCIIIYENEKEFQIPISLITSFSKDTGKSGMPAITICYNDELGYTGKYLLESPNASEIYRYLNKNVKNEIDKKNI